MIQLLGAFAHPDDDVYTLGATLAAHRGEIEATLVFATSGEAGPITDPAAVSRDELGSVREREQLAAIEELRIDAWTRSRFLGLPDYHLPDVPFDELVEVLVHVIRELEPQVVVTFGPDGMTSHHDHIRVGEACTDAFDQAQASIQRPPRYLFYTALLRSAVDRFYTELQDTRYGEEGDLFNVAGVPDERIAVRFDARAFRRTKLDAILAHRTQICEWERIPEPLRWIFLDTEAFVQARPSTVAAEPRADLFEGLELEEPAR